MSQEQLHRPEAATAEESKVDDKQQEPAGMVEQEQPAGELVQQEEQEQEQVRKQTPASPITYGDVFPAAVQEVAEEVITPEDASLMQTAEAMAFGQTVKGGAASMMQSAAAKNVQAGFIEKDAHSKVAEYGLSVSETSVPGATMDIEYVAGQPVFASAKPTPTDPAIASSDAVTIGEALEAAAVGAGERPIDEADARAILSAEARATGHSMPMKGGIGASAQSAAELNKDAHDGEKTTLADVLTDAASDLPLDKAVTYEDAYKVMQAELRGRSVDELKEGGVAATLVAAADLNQQSGLIPPPPALAGGHAPMEQDADDKQDDPSADELMKYHPLNSTQSADLNKPADTEETTPLVKHDDEQPSAKQVQENPTPKEPAAMIA